MTDIFAGPKPVRVSPNAPGQQPVRSPMEKVMPGAPPDLPRPPPGNSVKHIKP